MHEHEAPIQESPTPMHFPLPPAQDVIGSQYVNAVVTSWD